MPIWFALPKRRGAPNPTPWSPSTRDIGRWLRTGPPAFRECRGFTLEKNSNNVQILHTPMWCATHFMGFYGLSMGFYVLSMGFVDRSLKITAFGANSNKSLISLGCSVKKGRHADLKSAASQKQRIWTARHALKGC